MPTRCYKCGKSLTSRNFDVMIGTTAFFLCGKHSKELRKMIDEWTEPTVI